jgi:carbon storage regulator
MLVLSRKIGQRIAIGGGIVITVVTARGSQVRLGIEAPRDVAILREELAPPLSDAEATARPACASRPGLGSTGRRSR